MALRKGLHEDIATGSRQAHHSQNTVRAAMKQTLYQILGVDPKASAQEIEAAYIARIDELKFATLQDPNKLRVLQQSKEILADPAQRATYDASISRPEALATAPIAPEPPEASFIRQWGKWVAAGVILIGLFVLWPKRVATPPPPATKQAVPRPAAPLPQPVQPPAPNSAAPSVTGAEPPAAVQDGPVQGQWLCTDAISGRASKYNFQQDAVLRIAASDGQIADYKYELAGKILTLTDPKQVSTLAVEELTTRKMILNTGAEGRRIVCAR
jgi:hypothetical protein